MPQPTANKSEAERQVAGSELNLEQLLRAIRRLDAAARSQVAQALAESEMDARFKRLILSLARRPPVDEISDAEIQAEVDAVREHRLC